MAVTVYPNTVHAGDTGMIAYINAMVAAIIAAQNALQTSAQVQAAINAAFVNN